jgi:hypothetical protein
MNDNSFVFELDAKDKPINGRRGYLALMKDSRTERLIAGSNLLSVSSSLSNRCVPTEKETTHMGMRQQVVMRTRLRFGGIGVRTRLRIGEYRVALSHFCNHAWQCMGSTWRPNHQWCLRVTQVREACDHIRFRARCRARQGTQVMAG